MKTPLKLIVAAMSLAAVLSAQAPAPATTPAKAPAKAASKKIEATPPPSAQDIATAQQQGMVWVNLGTGVYHKNGEFYGKTKKGKFMTEADATKAGYRAAKDPTASKKAPKKDATKPAAATK